jgi:hypothetical protein
MTGRLRHASYSVKSECPVLKAPRHDRSFGYKTKIHSLKIYYFSISKITSGKLVCRRSLNSQFRSDRGYISFVEASTE